MKRGKKPGSKKTGGRVKGTPNKATATAREAIARFVDNNAPKFDQWLDEIYREDGARAAMDCVTSLIEYHVPKLARTELTGKDGEPFVIERTYFGPNKNT